MKLQDQVCTLEQAKRLKELGIVQHSLFYCHLEDDMQEPAFDSAENYKKTIGEAALENAVQEAGNPSQFSYSQSDVDEQANDMWMSLLENIEAPVYSAFTVAELGVMLPEFIEDDELGSLVIQQSITTKAYKKWHCHYFGLTKSVVEKVFGYTMVDAMANMLISLLSEKTITAEEVNSRLNS